MRTEVNFDTYVERMKSMKDKSSILDYVPTGSKVLDYGCSSGELSKFFEVDNYLGYDIAPMMIERAKSEHPGYRFTTELDPNEKFDAIVMSSLLHEIYSYNGRTFEKVIELLDRVSDRLTSNGVLVIRDGIKPKDGALPLALQLTDAHDASSFLAHLKNESPFEFNVDIQNDVLIGEISEIAHFLNVYTWGWKSIDREKYERVNFATLNEWMTILEKSGYRPIEHNVISQNEYFSHLSKLVNLNGASWETKIFIAAKKAM